MAKRVGFTAATTLPSAATSRTKCPRLTVVMLRPLADTMWLVLDQACANQANTMVMPSAPAPTMTHRIRRRLALESVTTLTCAADIRTVEVEESATGNQSCFN